MAVMPLRRRLLVPVVAAAASAALLGCGAVPDQVNAPQPRLAARTPSGSTSEAAPTAPPDHNSPAPSASSSKKTHKQTANKPSHTTHVLIFRPGDNGSKIRELQARLKQLDWYTGNVTEHYGDRTTAAVKGFQQKRRLPSTGTVDQKTWSKLVRMTTEPTHDELNNILQAGPAIMEQDDQTERVRELQARLKQLDWFTEDVTGFYGSVTVAAVRGFQDKHGLPSTGAVDQATWSALVSMSRQPTAAELSGTNSSARGSTDGASDNGGSTAGLDQRCLTGRAMCIDKTTDQLVWVIDGKPQLHFDVRFGADTTPTREGSFSVGWKARDWTSTIYHSEMPFSMFFSGGQAVHYSSDFAARGYYGASHGCVNVRDYAGIENLFGQVRVGDKVIVYRS